MVGEKPFTTRRKVLEKVGTGAVGISAITSPAIGKNIDTISIPYIIKGNTVRKRKDVPQSWYAHIKDTINATREAQTRYSRLDGVVGFGATRWKKRFGGKNGLQIKAHVLSGEYAGGLPDSVSGIPVTKSAIEQPPQLTGGYCSNIDKFNPTPGGVNFGDNSGGGASCCTPVENSNGKKGMLSAWHVFNSSCPDDINGVEVEQYCNDWGTIFQYDESMDYAIAESNSTYSVEAYIRNEDGTEYPVGGHYSETAVCDFASDGTTVRKQGVTTGTTKGAVTQCHYEDTSGGCITYDGHGVVSEANTANGDSGGVAYKITTLNSTQEAVVVNINNAGTNDIGDVSCDACGIYEIGGDIYDKNYGTAFYRLNNVDGITTL